MAASRHRQGALQPALAAEKTKIVKGRRKSRRRGVGRRW